MRGHRLLSLPLVMIAVLAGCSQDPSGAAAGPPRQIDCATLAANPAAYAGSRVIVHASQDMSEMSVTGGEISWTTVWNCAGADGAAASGTRFMTRRTGRDANSLTGETWAGNARTANVYQTSFRISGTAGDVATHHFSSGDVSALMIEQAQIELANGAQEEGNATAPN